MQDQEPLYDRARRLRGQAADSPRWPPAPRAAPPGRCRQVFLSAPHAELVVVVVVVFMLAQWLNHSKLGGVPFELQVGERDGVLRERDLVAQPAE